MYFVYLLISDTSQDHDVEGSPLFLTVSYMNPHSPLQALEDDLGRVPGNVNNTVRTRTVITIEFKL